MVRRSGKPTDTQLPSRLRLPNLGTRYARTSSGRISLCAVMVARAPAQIAVHLPAMGGGTPARRHRSRPSSRTPSQKVRGSTRTDRRSDGRGRGSCISRPQIELAVLTRECPRLGPRDPLEAVDEFFCAVHQNKPPGTNVVGILVRVGVLGTVLELPNEPSVRPGRFLPRQFFPSACAPMRASYAGEMIDVLVYPTHIGGGDVHVSRADQADARRA